LASKDISCQTAARCFHDAAVWQTLTTKAYIWALYIPANIIRNQITGKDD
jgi:hypothetical protein